MADEEAVDAFVHHALLGGNGDLPADLGVLALVGAVAGAVADGQRVAAGLFEEVDGLQGVGVGGSGTENVILHTGQHAQLALDGDAEGMCILDDLAGQLHVVLVGQAGTVDHHGGVAAGDAGFDALKALAVVEVQGNGYGAVGTVFFDGVADVLGTLLLGFQRAVHEVQLAAHEGVGSLGTLQDRTAAQQLVDADSGLDLPHAVHVEGTLTVMILVGGFQNRSHWY